MSKEKPKLSKAQKKKIAKQAAQNAENVQQNSIVETEIKTEKIEPPPHTSNIEYKTLKLISISPVHIGNGEKLKAVEYIYDSSKQTVYFLDESKWIKFLYDKNLIDEFTKYVERTAHDSSRNEEFIGNNVWEWLTSLPDKKITSAELRGLSIRQASATTNTIIGKRTLNDIACHIATAEGEPYIPGSSIKGLFRTAILHSFIKNFSDEEKKSWWDKIAVTKDLSLKEQQKKCGEIIQALEDKIFSKLDYKNGNAQTKSVMRGLLVSDANFARSSRDPRLDTVILQKIDSSTKSNLYGQTEKTLPLFRECIPAGKMFTFNVTLDLNIMKKIGVNSTAEILEMTENFTSDVLNLLQEVFGGKYSEQFKNAANANAFIGGGTGFIATTLLYSIAPLKDDARNFIANYFDKIFNHAHEENDDKISPRTLKLTKSSKGKQIFGLCNLEVK